MHQRIDYANAAALKRGEVLNVMYKDNFRHRLLLEVPLPSLPTEWIGAAFRYLTRHPVDVYVAHSVTEAERMLAQLSKRHGEWTLERTCSVG